MSSIDPQASKGTKLLFHVIKATINQSSAYQQLQPLQRCNPVESPIPIRPAPSATQTFCDWARKLDRWSSDQWNKYIKTSAKERNQADKPTLVTATQKLGAARLQGERKGWAFDHIALTASRWAMTDKITFTLPCHTKENPLTHVASLREAISEAYHLNWMRHSAARNKVQKDKDAGTQLPRGRPNTRK